MTEKVRSSANGSPSRPENTTSKLDQLLYGLLKAKGVQQAVAAIESGDGSFRWSGVVSKEKTGEPEPGTQNSFLITSVTKLFISTAVLKLQEQELLSLDRPAGEYLFTGLNQRHRF